MDGETKRTLRGRRTLLLVLAILGAVSVSSAGTVSYGLYRAALEQHRQRLVEFSDSWAHLISSVAEFDRQHSALDDQDGAVEATLLHVRQTHPTFRGFGATGEYTLARLHDGQIEFLLSHRNDDFDKPPSVPMGSPLAEPMRRALRGESGTMVGNDYRGAEVMAAYRPIPQLGVGLVAKLDMVEVRAPFMRAGFITGLIISVMLLVAAAASVRVLSPMLRDLEESEQRHRTLVESIREAILTVDTGGTITSYSSSARLLFGYSREEMLGQPVQKLLPEQRREGFEDAFKRVATSRDPEPSATSVEMMALRKDGTEIPVGISWAPFELQNARQFCAVIRDISARRRRDADTTRLATAIDHIDESVYITDAHGTIQYVNPAFERTTGYSAADAIGRTPRILNSGAQNRAFYEDLWHTISSGERWSGRITNRRRDGSLYEAILTISPVIDHRARITNFVAVKRDITNELEREERIRRSQKMAVIGQIAGGIAHDFNNLLTGISGYVQLSLAAPNLEPQVNADLNDALSMIRKAGDLTSRLLLSSRHAPIRRKTVDLGHLVDESIKLLTPMLGENVRVRSRTDSSEIRAQVDPSQFEQVLMNLVLNARDAMAGSGWLSIRTATELVGPTQAMKLGLLPGSYATLTVKDDGHGMDAATLDQVFDPFFTTKKAGAGTGLGLSTAYGIVQEHDGAIEADSRPGQGATFKVYVPARDEALLGEAERPEPLAGAGETILLVEDEPAVLHVVQRQLSQSGYEVLAAASPQQAEKMYARHGDEVSLLLTDIVMPGSSGIALYRHLAERTPDLKVVFMSGYLDQANELDPLLEAGAAFVPKPLRLADLMHTVRAELDA